MERLRFLTSLPLAGTVLTEGGGATITLYPISLLLFPPNSIPNLGVQGLFGPTLPCSYFDSFGVLGTDDAVGEDLVN